MKLWDKGTKTNEWIERFTIGQDNFLDIQLAEWDVLGTIAHIQMLESIGLLKKEELEILKEKLKIIYQNIKANHFQIKDGVEDIHSQVEFELTEQLGEIGKKIHSGRSRNDQVLLDLKLFMRNELKEIANETKFLFEILIQLSNQYQHILLPGYTHFQVAMPSSFGLWLGAYAESLTDDLLVLQSIFRLVNQNPLGSGAGYGSSFPLDRQMTTDLLGFEQLNYNVVYAQMTRGKAEKNVAYALANIAHTLSRLSMDITLYLSQNFAFLSFPDNLTTGSSIMPHKKNPDVFELIRAKCNKIQALPNEIILITNNLPSGYHRDLQILKEGLFPALQTLKDCIQLMAFMLPQMQVNEKIIDDAKYLYIFSVEEVNKLVLQGVPFREAYQQIGEQIKQQTFQPEKTVSHTHEGSIGKLCNEKITEKMQQIYFSFNFEYIENALNHLIME